MRFLQISNVRLGADPESEKNWGRERAAEIKESLKKALCRASEESCDLFLITGGLFSHQPVTSELSEVNRLFLSFPALQIVMISGRLDPLCKNAPARSFKWAPNVHFAAEDGLVRFRFPGIGTTVYAAAFGENGAEPVSALCRTYQEKFAKEETAAVKLLLLPELPFSSEEQKSEKRKNAGISGEGQTSPIKEVISPMGEKAAGKTEEISAALSGFSYIAAGGAAQHAELIPGKAYCAGTSEPLSMAEAGEHGYYIGDLSSATGRLIDIRFEAAAAASYVPLLISVTPETGQEALLSLLRTEMEKRGKQNIYRLRISGRRSPDAEFNLEPLLREFRIAEFLDETVPQYDLSELFAEHPQDMIGFYIGRLRSEEMERSAVEEKAMYYGIDALLKTSGKP